jgi:hypothetical protein
VSFVWGTPIVYNDPSGHCVLCYVAAYVIGVIVGTVTYDQVVAPALGRSPDNRGIDNVGKYMNPATDSITVAAGIAVQSQWYNPLTDTRNSPLSGENSGLGMAQVSDAQMKEYGLGDLDQEDPSVAVQAMQKRIQLVQDACVGCGATDLLVAAALAQNGSFFTSDSMTDVMERYQGDNGNIDWATYFNQSFSETWYANVREGLTSLEYNTQLMLLLYIQDLRELYNNGWALPDGITEEDLDYLEDLATGG